MMRRKELTGLLDEKTERVLVLETKLDSMQQQLDGYKEREQSIIASLSAAQTAAARQLNEAEAPGKALLDEAEQKARRTMAAAEQKAAATLENADSQARAMIENAKAQAEKLLSDGKNRRTALLAEAEADQAACLQDVRRLNGQIAESAAAAMAAAERFSALCEKYRVEPAADKADSGDFAAEPLTTGQEPPREAPADLPDPAEDPARLMHNIYEIQNRDIPAYTPAHAAEPEAPQDVPETDPVSFDEEEIPDFAPKPEDAFADAPAEEPYAPEPDWQPEEEPEQGAPTVDQLMPDDDQVAQSLDALLDEIIRAGE